MKYIFHRHCEENQPTEGRLIRRSNPLRVIRELREIASSELLRFAAQFLLAMTALMMVSPNCYSQSKQTKSLVLARVAAIPVRRDFAIVAAKIRTGTDTAAAYRELDTLLSRAYGDMFWMYGCAGLYYEVQDVLRPSYKARIRWCWKHFTPYRGDTENHFLMYYGMLLLMSQAWPDLPDTDWFMGKSSKEIYAESAQYLNHWMDETVRNGQEEWDSPRYGYYYITPLVLLATYTKDSHLRHRFEMMLEYELASYAVDYLDGCYCGAHSRVGDDAAIDPRKAEITTYGKYFFEDSVSHLLPDVAVAAMTPFECPKIIREIATDRSQPYEQFSIKRGRQMLRYMDKWSASDSSHDSTFHAPVYKYDYMTKDYCLGSMQGGIVQPIQQQSWSLVFNSEKPNNIITGLNPYVSSTELGLFFPEYPSFMLERISGTKASYTSEDKWVGGSPYERIYQDKNVLVALYDLPDTEKYREYDVFIPYMDLDSRILASDSASEEDTISVNELTHGGSKRIIRISSKNSLLLTCDSAFGGCKNSVNVFIYSFAPFHVIHEARGLRLRSKNAHGGFVIWCNPDWLGEETNCDSVYIQNGKLEGLFSYGQHRRKILDLKKTERRYPDWLFHSPCLESKKGSGILTMRYKGETRVLDFNR